MGTVIMSTCGVHSTRRYRSNASHGFCDTSRTSAVLRNLGNQKPAHSPHQTAPWPHLRDVAWGDVAVLLGPGCTLRNLSLKTPCLQLGAKRLDLQGDWGGVVSGNLEAGKGVLGGNEEL